MRLGGLQKLTLLDFPEHTACTVFTQGCNLRCPFCHNSSLVLPEVAREYDEYDAEEFFDFLKKRTKLLDGVCITGGEPLLQQDIRDFIVRIRDLGFKVKLDTNGSFPEKLKELLDDGLVDYVAMDIKSSLEGYKTIGGVNNPPTDKIRESIKLLKDSNIPYEFRTTIVEEFHNEEVLSDIGKLIEGAPRYYLQRFEDSGMLICEELHPVREEKLHSLLQTVRRYVPNAQIRGGEIG